MKSLIYMYLSLCYGFTCTLHCKWLGCEFSYIPVWIVIAYSVSAKLFQGGIFGPCQVITVKTKTSVFSVQPCFFLYLKCWERTQLKTMIRLSLISTYNTCKLSVIGTKIKFRLYCFAQHRGKQVLGKPKDLHGKKDRRIYPSERSTTSSLTSPVFENC